FYRNLNFKTLDWVRSRGACHPLKLDTHATQTGAVLYGELTAGMSVSEALALTYQALLKKPKEKEQARNDWHLLRLYIAGEVPGALVTLRDEPDRELSIVQEAAKEFLDPDTKEVKVTGRQGFVGRRRPLQNCLRALSISSKQVGVIIYGMGGLGKSTLAARICDRLSSRFERLVLVGKIDEPKLVKLLNDKLENQVFRDQLLSQTEELKFRLRSALKNLFQKDKKKLLLVLDDFEQNLEQREHGFVLSSDAAKVLTALVWALRESSLIHRLIITCRYNFDFSGLQHFYNQPLAALSPADIQKKCSRLESFQTNSKLTLELQKQALEIADGNPRLLEWLNKTLQDSAVNHAEILTSLAKNPVELREQVLAQELLNCIGEPMQQMLQLGRIFEIPVPRVAIEEICIDISDLSTHINRAIALGLLELSTDETVKVPRILSLQLEYSEVLYNQAAQCLYRLWREESRPRTEQQFLEIYRLALLGKDELIAADICAILSNFRNSTSRYREVISLCQSTLSIIYNEQYKMVTLLNQGDAYNSLGLYQEAINSYQESKFIAKALPDINFDGAVTGNLGNCYYNIGQIEQAINCYIQALEIASTSGDEDLQGIWHSNLGNTYSLLGKISLAVDNYEKALAICTKNKNRQSEACCCCNLCDCYGLLGNSELAINYAKQALTILEEIPDLDVKATTLHSLAEILIDEERYDEAMLCAKEGIEIARLVDSAKVYSENYSALACAYLYSNTNDDKLSDAWEAAENANNYDVPQNNHYVSLLLGLIALKQRNPELAKEKFTDALENAEKFISENQYAYGAWYIKWLALSGLTLSADVENQKYALEAEIAYQQAKSINNFDGVLKRVKHLFKIITSVDVEKCLDNLQKIVQGE
ncbi:MAG: tetratricopeptide repeat protein, partial [Rivularia sp. (in: cyanobacteria)]